MTQFVYTVRGSEDGVFAVYGSLSRAAKRAEKYMSAENMGSDASGPAELAEFYKEVKAIRAGERGFATLYCPAGRYNASIEKMEVE